MTISKPAGRLRPSSSSESVLSQSSANSNDIAVGEPPHRTDTCNVVIFGESGAGKSSLVNLIAGKDVAATSSDTAGCTTGTSVHEILIRNETLKVKLFDTAGLDEDPQGAVPDKEARRILKKLVHALMEQGDIHLIIYCVRSERVIRTLRRNYEFIHSQVKRKVPIVLVVTSLESYKQDMEEWWRLNENTISELGMTFAGHACVTTGMITQSNVTERGRKQSYDAVCQLIEQCRSNESVYYTGPSQGTTYNIPSKLAASSNRHTNIVLFGQAGAGKSSLVNLMAGENVARTSSDMRSCTLHWQKYPIEFDGKSYNVFDTVGLEEPQLGIPQYLDAIENAYRLIQDLERQGGIDLLLFCMRAGRVTSTVQNNYRLFHEFLCDMKVPVVVVITYLENEVGEMDDWWKRNKYAFDGREIYVAGHACITAIRGNYPDRYEQSRTTICKLVAADGQREAWKGGDNTFVSFMRKLTGLLAGKEKSRMRKNMVSCLIKRCGLSSDVAKQLADRIKNGMVGRAT
ncbi:P-loop containing nucleoside triphosphate hydrolase protein [Suillus subaureus]|uniref:P-loop containing nucleoside triphosphate hydrolase protein n=1 Tax=Suillus subaureus TaxID=48587 RepID=A0A9P7E9I5_9AGAM|nr:P-loop containing nucleoside triphosphate hydrolase protein [Suillus subaureus]KAG1815223.1 P-loop containing nucleoside triphosphate hydrolase protein [Suillus subaureus]